MNECAEVNEFDVIVIGAGMAGAAVAGNLAADKKVLVLEQESQPGYHATGRSAALFSEIYGAAAIRSLSRASRDFLFNPPDGFTESPLVRHRGVLYIANAAQLARLAEFANLPDISAETRLLTVEETIAFSPTLRPDYIAAGLYEPGAHDLDVNSLHQGYLKMLRQRGGRVICNAKVQALTRRDGTWKVTTGAGEFYGATVVNAAGAWVDQIAELAGCGPIGIQPMKRSACIAALPIGLDARNWPLTCDIDEQFYFKPDAGNLLISPADETSSPPCDAWAEDIDIATAIDRISNASTLEIRRVLNSWAGLRSFVADRNPVIGYDPRVAGFFWIAALGGYGIQTAPAVGRLAAALIQSQEVPADMLAQGLHAAELSPARFS